MRKLGLRMISAVLGVVLTFQNPLQAFAATKQKYVSDVILSYGNTEEEAKKWLTDNGYEVVDKNLNENADSVFDKARAVYMGYRTTNDASEAITDMKTMNMKGDYSFDKYEEVLEQQKTNIQNFVKGFLVTVQEYRENYQKNNPRAIATHDLLNMFRDDLKDTSGNLLSTDQLLGDLLLNPVKQEMSDAEYEKLAEDEKKQHADLVEMLLRGNSASLKLMEQYLALAADCGDDTWMERLEELGGFDGLYDSYEISNKKKTTSEIYQMLTKNYDEKAQVLAEKLSDFREIVSEYEAGELKLTDEPETIAAYFEAHPDEDCMSWMNAAAAYENTCGFSYDDGTLYDVLMDESADYENSAEDRMMLYPIIASLSDGQLAALDYLSVTQLLWCALDADSDTMSAYEDTKSLRSEEQSMYEGVNQALFEGGVALTERAQQEQASSDIYYTEYFYDKVSPYVCVELAGAAVFGIAAIVASDYNAVMAEKTATAQMQVKTISYKSVSATQDAIDGFSNQYKSLLEKYHLSDMKKSYLEKYWRAKSSYFDDGFSQTTWLTEDNAASDLRRFGLDKIAQDEELSSSYVAYQKTKASVQKANGEVLVKEESFTVDQNTVSTLSTAKLLSIAFNFVCAVLAIWAVVSFVIDLIEYYNTDLTEIPHFIAERADKNETDVRNFTLYEVVRCNRQEMGMKPADNEVELLKDYGDLNGDIGKEWVALYTTKDLSAGNPITTDFIVQYGDSKVPLGAKSLTMFSYANPVNLIDEHYVYEGTTSDGKQGIYLFFTQDKNANLTGTVMTNGTIAAICGGGVLVIGGIAAALFAAKKKKKKDEKPAA